MNYELIKCPQEKDTCDYNYSQFSISEIRYEKQPFCTSYIMGVGDQNKTINQCFDDVTKQEKQKIKERVCEFSRIQELMKLKLENYLNILQKEIKRKEERNNNLRKEIVDLQDEVFDCGGDIAILSQLQEERKERKSHHNQLKVLKSAECKLNQPNAKSKSKSKINSTKKHKEKDKKSPKRGVHSTSGKKKKKCSPPPRKQTQLKKLIF